MCSVILLAKTPKTAVNRGMYYNELRATYVHVSVTFASSIKVHHHACIIFMMHYYFIYVLCYTLFQGI